MQRTHRGRYQRKRDDLVLNISSILISTSAVLENNCEKEQCKNFEWNKWKTGLVWVSRLEINERRRHPDEIIDLQTLIYSEVVEFVSTCESTGNQKSYKILRFKDFADEKKLCHHRMKRLDTVICDLRDKFSLPIKVPLARRKPLKRYGDQMMIKKLGFLK